MTTRSRPLSADQRPSNTDPEVRSWAVEEFKDYTGSALGFAAFGAIAFDEVAYVPIAAAVDRTGRFADNFADRGIRSLTRGYLSISTDDVDRERYAAELQRAHRVVRGEGRGDFTGIRYSALEPRLWNWILMSGFMVYLRTFGPATGIALNEKELEAAYQYLYGKFEALTLPSTTYPFPTTYKDAVEYYSSRFSELEPNSFLDQRVRGLTRLPLPTLILPPPLRVLLTPIWYVVRPLVGHVIRICSFGAMPPEVLATTRFKWKRRHDMQFRFFTKPIQMAWKFLPDRIMLEPIYYNRKRHRLLTDVKARARSQLRYEKLVQYYASLQLDTFAAPGDSIKGCPM